MMMTTVIKHTLDPNRTKPCDDKTTQKEEEEGGGGGGYFSSFQSSLVNKDGRSKVSFSLKRRLLMVCKNEHTKL